MAINPIELSREYYKFIDAFSQTEYEDEKLLGKFYTDYSVADNMIDIVLENIEWEEYRKGIKVIDPFCGDGRLILSLLTSMKKRNLLNGITIYISIWDIDSNAVNYAKGIISTYCNDNGIIFELEARVSDAFVSYYPYIHSYDICVTNPPWSLIKPQKLFQKSITEEMQEQYRSTLESYDSYMKDAFALSQPSSKFGKWGTNLARCGTELAMRLIQYSGICGIVSPASLFNDQVSGKLRAWIFENYRLINVSYYPAELKLYGCADVSSVTFVAKRGVTDQALDVKMFSDRTTFKQRKLEKAVFEFIKQKGYGLPLKTGIEAIPIMMFLEELPTTQEFCCKCKLSFAREMDETRFKERILDSGEIEFAKGYMVDRFKFTSANLYLNESVYTPPISSFKPKLVWRDVSRDSQLRRVKATILPSGYICGNSLGVIYCEEKMTPYLKVLLAIFNSMVFEYQARSLLVSNHVSAGIIKQIHVPEPVLSDEIISLIDKQLNGDDMEELLELAVAKMYGLSIECYEVIVRSFDIHEDLKDRLIKQYAEFKGRNGEISHMIYNHYASTLSDLDMQIVHCVPPGGNWKNIPESVPSQRLAQIRESYKAGKGSRSTYYGRLRPDMPAYTINTYFNRPGNGCHIHYEQDRTISQREAARFQSFPDSFEFIGSIGAVNNQIGNAVPPLLAYQIAKTLPFKGQFIDLFCGAGGLALGFIWAGWKPIIGNDIDKYAIETHKRNIGGSAIVGDINTDEIQRIIVEKAMEARKSNPHLPLFVLGGPPCQGFSTANTRRGADDLRNWLFKSYAHIVEMIRPEGFVFENVRGILNMDKGRFFEMIKVELKECVDEIKVNQVSAANYGVPQRRDRVIIIGGKKKMVDEFSIPEISCVPKNGQLSMLPTVIGVEDAIGDLPSLNPGEDGSSFDYRFPASNPYQKFMRGLITPDEYLESYAH